VRRRHVELEHLDEPGQPRRLSLGELEHEPRQRRGVDDRVLERAFQTATHEPRVEGVVAVLDEDGAVGETQKSAARIAKLRRADKHRPIDVMAPMRIWVDRRLAVDERVEEGERPVEPEALGPELKDEER
jgi:hypothetical protein